MILEPQFTEQSGGYRIKDFMTSDMKSNEGQMTGGAPYEKMISDSLCIPFGLVNRFNDIDGTEHYGEVIDLFEEGVPDIFEVPDILFDRFLQKVSVKRIKPSIKGSRKSRISIFSNKKTQRKRK
jgi:hypothetical protein